MLPEKGKRFRRLRERTEDVPKEAMLPMQNNEREAKRDFGVRTMKLYVNVDVTMVASV